MIASICQSWCICLLSLSLAATTVSRTFTKTVNRTYLIARFSNLVKGHITYLAGSLESKGIACNILLFEQSLHPFSFDVVQNLESKMQYMTIKSQGTLLPHEI